MATTITTRAGKGSALTHAEMDSNLTALRDTADSAATAGVAATAHAASASNPHAVTKAQVGLGSVDNTADTAKPVSTAQAAAIAAAVTAHTQAADPHPGYLTPAEGAALYSPTGAYVKPTDGVPRQDLDLTTRGQLDLAAAALQPGAQLTQAVANSTTAAGTGLMTGVDAAAQRATLGLGTAATTASTAYATAAQGTKADNALAANADAIADVLEASATGAPADLARIQSLVSGGFVGAKIYATTTATVPAATNYQYSFGLTEYASGLTVSGNNIVVNTSGYYLLLGVCRVADSTPSGRQFSIGVHTRTDDGVWNYWFSVGSATRQTFSNTRIAYYVAGEILKMSSYSDQGLNVTDRSFTVLLIKAA